MVRHYFKEKVRDGKRHSHGFEGVAKRGNKKTIIILNGIYLSKDHSKKKKNQMFYVRNTTLQNKFLFESINSSRLGVR